MQFSSYVEIDRLCRCIDPVLFYALFIINDEWSEYVETIFSCQGHDKGEPAWIKFRIKNQQWWDEFATNLSRNASFEIVGDTLNIFHSGKKQLIKLLHEAVSIGGNVCQMLRDGTSSR